MMQNARVSVRYIAFKVQELSKTAKFKDLIKKRI